MIIICQPLADWVATEYRNQNNPSTFYSYGGLENYNGRVYAEGALLQLGPQGSEV